VARALVATGTDPEQPTDLATSRREMVTVWWAGSAAGLDYLD
jgi:hypothetical protein